MEDPYVRRHSLLVYPEATRNLTDKPYVLKHGFTKVNSFNTHPFKNAWRRKIPIQLSLSYGLENIVTERKLKLVFE